MGLEFVELRVHGVSLGHEDSSPIIVLEEPGGCRRLMVPVGPFEASAIIMELEGMRPPKPMTHDLLAEFFRDGGFILERTELFGAPGESLRARLCYRRGFDRLEREARPADAIALALRLESPVAADQCLFQPRLSSAPVKRSRSLRNARILPLSFRRRKAQ